MNPSPLVLQPIGRVAYGRSADFLQWLEQTFVGPQAFCVVRDPEELLQLLREQPVDLFLLEEDVVQGMNDYLLSLVRECNAEALSVRVVATGAMAHGNHSPLGACVVARDWPKDAVTGALSDLARLWATRRRVTRLAGRLDHLRQRDARQHHAVLTQARQLLHDIATPLAIAQGSCANVVDGVHGAVPAEQKEPLDRALQAIAVQTELIDELRARLELATRNTQDRLIAVRSNQRRQLRLGQLCNDVAQLLSGDARERGITLSLQLGEVHPIWGDRVRLSQLVTNLMINAIRFTPAGGVISLCLENLERDERGRSAVRLAIRDTGPGVPMADRPRIFERGFTTGDPQEHSGMGLAICNEIALEHNGTIRVGGIPGEGAVFEVILPADPRQRGKRPVRIVRLRDDSELSGLKAALGEDAFRDETLDGTTPSDGPTARDFSRVVGQAETVVFVEPSAKAPGPR